MEESLYVMSNLVVRNRSLVLNDTFKVNNFSFSLKNYKLFHAYFQIRFEMATGKC